jgi:apolipoprotein N-acyltransferase
MQKSQHTALKILSELALLLLSAVLFSLSFPSLLSTWGWFPLGFFSIIPVFVVVHRCSWALVFPYGLFFGFSSYAIFNYWLSAFHPLAIFVVPIIYGGFFLILFPVLKLIDQLFPRHGYIFQSLAWLAYEYLKTTGFLGYAYGVIGYTQYLFLPLIQIAALTGVWGVSLIVIFPSAYLGNALKAGWSAFLPFLKGNWVPTAAYGVVFCSALIFGFTGRADLAGSDTWRVALVQQNMDPWREGFRAYERSLEILTRMSREALKEDPDIIIWSETSFVPSIDWHTKYRTSDRSYQLVRRLKDFLEDQQISYVFGNNDVQRRVLPTGEEIRLGYNATLLYRNNQIERIYRKLHLVPFSEHFPYRGILSPLYNLLISRADIHWYEKGRDWVVFEDGGVTFSTPICFEDTFGYLNRGFVQRGADVLVNLTNDLWSHSVPAEMQHMAMAVFRTVENRRSLVRSTNGGMTTIVDPNGKIRDILPAFVESYLVGDVPVLRGVTTLYSRWGDWLAWTALVSVPLGIGVGVLLKLLLRKKQLTREQESK